MRFIGFICSIILLGTLACTQTEKNKLVSDYDSLSYAIGLDISDYLSQAQEPLDHMFCIEGMSDFKTNAGDKSKDLSGSDSMSYIIGYNVGQQINHIFQEVNFEIVYQAMKESHSDVELKMDKQYAREYITNFSLSMNLKEANEFLENNRKEDDVQQTESGLQYLVITEGTGQIPGKESNVRVHYKGTLIDGTVFDSSYDRGQPAEFPVNGVIQGWVETLQMMKEGAKWKIFVPPHLAYGERGAGGGAIGPNQLLIFEVELIKVLN
ncbi:FKBP-type peptidyl-prolyl cis-trans isomerase [Bacteroidota bacterium]